MTKLLKKADIHAIFATLQAANPHPKSDLDYTNPYTLLVAVVLSAQTTDKGVNAATKALFRIADTPAKMVKLGEEKLKDHIKTIGLYNTKAKNVIALSHILVNDYGGKIPQTHAELIKLPGVGRKTANVVMNIAFGAPTIAVDTHVFRLANRLGLSNGTTPDQVEEDLVKVVPKEFLRHAHHWLILHGRYVCTARKPKCGECSIAKWCQSFPLI
jgi:endonuclease III